MSATVPDVPRTMTVDEFLRDPKWEHFELIDGIPRELPLGKFRHSTVISLLSYALWDWIRSKGFGSVAAGEQSVRLDDGRLLYKADVCWSPLSRHDVPAIPDSAFPLMIEVISDGNTIVDMARKISDYLEYGAEEVWEIQPDAELILIHRKGTDPKYLRRGDTYTTSLLPEFELKLDELFA